MEHTALYLWFVCGILCLRSVVAYIGHRHGAEPATEPVATIVDLDDDLPTFRSCLIAGSSFHRTFDGLTYDSPGTGSYLVAKHEQDWHIAVTYNNCEREEFCTLSLTVKLAGGITVEMTGTIVLMNGELVEVTTDTPVTDHAKMVEISREDYGIITSGGGEVLIQFDLRKTIMISIKTESAFKPIGLCGNANGDPSDDLWMEQNFEQGDILHIAKFVTSYEIQPESLYQPIKTACIEDSTVEQAALGSCNLLLAAEFLKCKHLVNLRSFADQCVQKYCTASPWARAQVQCDHFEMVDLLCSIEGVELSWRTEYFCPKQCWEPDFVFKTNQPACHRTCAHVNSEMPAECIENRVSTCTCPENTYLQYNRCVPKEECRCEHNNGTYGHREKAYKHCNLCTCIYGEWSCDDKDCDATCSMFGFQHVITGDGRNYSFYSPPDACSFTLISATEEFKDTLMGLDIKVTTIVDPERHHGLLLDAVIVGINGNNYVINDHTVAINGQMQHLPYKTNTIAVDKPTDEYIHASFLGIDVLFSHTNNALHVNVDPMYGNKVVGLCGDFNKVSSDDFKISSDKNKNNNKKTSQLVDFVRHYTDVTGTCQAGIQERQPDDNIVPAMMTSAQQWCLLLKSEDMAGECLRLVDLDFYYVSCLEDMTRRANVLDYGPLRTVISALRRRCKQLDSTLVLPAILASRSASEKADDSTCNHKENAKLCVATRTCRNLGASPVVDCDNSRLVSGCMCPDGHVRNNDDRCVVPAECPCVDEKDGRTHLPGTRVERGSNTCTCLNGSFACCPGNQVMLVNSKACQTTCREKDTCDDGYSYTGCGCQEGTTYDETQNDCVPSADCPCYADGKAYKTGETRPWLFSEQACKDAEWVESSMPPGF